MSNLIMVYLNEELTYHKIKKISDKLVKLSLKEKKGVIFNFFGYSENLIKEIDSNFYFSISDDYIQLNSEFFSFEHIKDIFSKKGKKIFYKKFRIFNDIYNLLKKNKINKMNFLICTDNSDEIKDFIILNNKGINILDFIYQFIVLNFKEYGYCFPNVIIQNEL